MSNPDTHINKPTEQDIDDVLHDFLGFLKGTFTDSAEKAGDSQDMLELGLKTEFAQYWESWVKNPVDSMYKTRLTIDNSLKSVIDKMVQSYLLSKKDMIVSALSLDDKNNLFYFISLKDDNLDNRIAISDFVDFYETYTLSSVYPVYFQFVQQEYLSKIKVDTKII